VLVHALIFSDIVSFHNKEDKPVRFRAIIAVAWQRGQESIIPSSYGFQIHYFEISHCDGDKGDRESRNHSITLS